MIKCVIWDLDNTVWRGTLLEDKNVALFENIPEILKTLDQRGILHSICSKNDWNMAMGALKRFGIDEYFLYPEISFANKSDAIEAIIKNFNIRADTVAFVDDEPYELDEVTKYHPDILCIPASEIDSILPNPAFIPQIVTEDARNRRKMYMADIRRDKSELSFTGPKEEFLKTLSMEIDITKATEQDLDRLVELTERTNQLNTTGYPKSYEELLALMKSENYLLFAVSLRDKYGDSGKVGLALIETDESKKMWTIELFIMSCRVATRGVGSLVLNCIMQEAKRRGVGLFAKFRDTGRNRLMYLSFSFAGFKLSSQQGECSLLENKLMNIQENPDYIIINQAL